MLYGKFAVKRTIMVHLTKYLLTSFEILNELYIAMCSGLLGTFVLVRHGFKSNQTFRTSLVASITLASFLYVSRNQEKEKPSRRKVIIITGCDTGLGFSLAQHAANCGFTVIAGFLNTDSEGAKSMRQQYGEKILQMKLDITSFDNIKNCVKTIENFLNNNPKYSLHALVNNAGVMIFGEFEWLTDRLIESQLEVNLYGTFKLTKAFCPLLRQHKGRLITITSHCAQATLPGLAVYGATKAALTAWSDGLRVEMDKYGVKVITFIPGSFPTESNIMSKQLLYVQEMHDAFTPEQHCFYSDYFKRYNIYLSYLNGPASPKKLENLKLYETFNNALLDTCPDAVYKIETFRYAMYHILFKISPHWLRDYFVTKFMKMPNYIPETCDIKDLP